ncbi:hypothetical protein BN2497_6115 [Janthinobacterium sp. CG23_2]|nr:hypothetical protein BN2497_6115 [Janthinobacterium sp. CG23_2]CUU29455.1 hypothetical protein BN3177_6115 [Janthinobacterium sp. CG23_2]
MVKQGVARMKIGGHRQVSLSKKRRKWRTDAGRKAAHARWLVSR